ncbi:MAG TPA: SirB2 family protein [Rhodoferax sp.]|nr:SirB2 family protein [Rhodoferax sp.]
MALLVYIVLGAVALKRGKTRAVRSLALVGAILVFGYIVAVALTRLVVPLSW